MLTVEKIIWGYKLTIIGVYAPNEDNGDTVKDEFFGNLNEEIIKSGSGGELIPMGDMNGRKTGDTVVGNFIEDKVKDNGEKLIELRTQTLLKIWNGFLIIKIYINIHGSNIQKILKLFLIT
jgi:hypothetical protein